MQITKLGNLMWLLLRSMTSDLYAQKHHTPGMAFAHFGRQIGLQMLLNRAQPSVSYLLAPVSITRYFEFPFACACLPEGVPSYLDISSPSLFSFYVATKRPGCKILMANPDITDCRHTQSVLKHLHIKNIDLQAVDARAVLSTGAHYACIWALSVLEHISGEYDDRYVARAMYEALEPAGRMIVTVPVDRVFWDEHREQNFYGVQDAQADGTFFFQRYYTENAIWKRLISPTGQTPVTMKWFGETVPGRFAEYERRWQRQGYEGVVDDAREIADFYREYDSWQDMPGKGVCGFMIVKKAEA